MSGCENILEVIKEGDFGELQKILKADKTRAMAKDLHGVSALMTALYYRKADMVRLLMEQITELDMFEAAALGEEIVLKQFLDDNKTAAAYSTDGFTPLHLAAFFNQPAIVKLLMEYGTDVNAVAENPSRVQALHSAAACGSIEIIKILLEHGADVNACQQGGWTALQSASKQGNLEMMELLLNYGADPDQAADDGQTALTMAANDAVRSHLGKLKD